MQNISGYNLFKFIQSFIKKFNFSLDIWEYEILKNHEKVVRVDHPSLATGKEKATYDKYYPNGAGSIFTFEIKGGAEEAKAFIDRLQIFSLLANVADVKSLVIHPASTTHSQMTENELLDARIKPNTIRLSIGIEHIDDLIEDLAQAFYKNDITDQNGRVLYSARFHWRQKMSERIKGGLQCHR